MVDRTGIIISINISGPGGGLPRRPVDAATVGRDGLAGDAHSFAKHIKPERAISLVDDEILGQLRNEGFAVSPGTIGENMTVRGLHVQGLGPGTRLVCDGSLELEITEARKPCFLLDAIDPRLKEVIVGRAGVLATVVKGGVVRIGARMAAVGGPCATIDEGVGLRAEAL